VPEKNQLGDSALLTQAPAETHDVFNQSPAFEDVNLFTSDKPLMEAAAREGAASVAGDLTRLGAEAGSAAVLGFGRLANESAPKLHRFDQKGRHLDVVEFHPAYHALMALSCWEGLHCSTWEPALSGAAPQPGNSHVARGARLYMMSQAEAGHMCPLTMTHACIPALRAKESLLERLAPKLICRDYDASFAPIASKRSITVGMGMTEKQGGTDVRANTTKAEPLGSGLYALTGHKWFMSAPMCDAFLVLAYAPGGLSCFFLPRFREDGGRNAIRIQRLKDKLGNRSNASSEVEFLGAEAELIGEEGRGIATIMEMVTLTRLDCALASAGLMRLALANAVRHAKHRTVFQKRLIDQPVMMQVLADLAVHSEAATALAFRLAGSFDRASDSREAAFRRLMTPVIKYFVCKTAPAFVYEAMECLGGNGYVEEGLMARAYREAPLNAIWEGSGNVMALDILRVLQREPAAADAVFAALDPGIKADKRIAAAADALRTRLTRPAGLEAEARHVAEQLALIAAGALLQMHAPHHVADAFIASRFGRGWQQTYGAGLGGADAAAITARAGQEL
jgi:putative acyl-CoA dehydrogenase